MVNSDGESLVKKYEKILEQGLLPNNAKISTQCDVLVVGAGISGLVASKLLKVGQFPLATTSLLLLLLFGDFF